jgi:hypothetical protein
MGVALIILLFVDVVVVSFLVMLSGMAGKDFE